MNNNRLQLADGVQLDDTVSLQTERLFNAHRLQIFRQTDRMFAGLMMIQWAAAIVAALVISPYTWIGQSNQVHVHVWAAIFLGGAISVLPVVLALRYSGETSTRYVVAVGQMLMGSLLIHLTGGRIETHFHVFGSLAFLAFYRDWKVLVPATIVVAADHLIRGLFFPQSVFGIATAENWRWLEHAGWVVFIDIFLVISCLRSTAEMHGIAEQKIGLIEANNDLQTEIAERRRVEEKLKASADELGRSNLELQHFASVASHDLQEPLRKIQSFADELKLNLTGTLDEENADTMNRMISAAGRMRTLINALLNFSRVTTQAKPFEPVDLNTVVTDVLSDLQIRVEETCAKIDTGSFPVIDADPVQMRQLIQNLVGNGLKFQRPGVIPKIGISGKNGGPSLQITVADNGIGFDEKYLDRIFTIFQRLHGRNEYEGTGIGLAICRKIVERHRGQITATSVLGEGSSFIITIPMKQAIEETV